jgi:hypothetical protein
MNSRRDKSTSSSSATLAQSLRFATLAQRKQYATADFPHLRRMAKWICPSPLRSAFAATYSVAPMDCGFTDSARYRRVSEPPFGLPVSFETDAAPAEM